MAGIPFIRDFKFDYGTAMEVTPLIRRVVAKNPSPFTFKAPAPTSSATATSPSSIRAQTTRNISMPFCVRCAARR